MQKIVVNLETGKQTIVDMTPEEIAAAKAVAEPPPPPKLTPVEKLAAAGLTVDDLKSLLGIQS